MKIGIFFFAVKTVASVNKNPSAAVVAKNHIRISNDKKPSLNQNAINDISIVSALLYVSVVKKKIDFHFWRWRSHSIYHILSALAVMSIEVTSGCRRKKIRR